MKSRYFCMYHFLEERSLRHERKPRLALLCRLLPAKLPAGTDETDYAPMYAVGKYGIIEAMNAREAKVIAARVLAKSLPPSVRVREGIASALDGMFGDAPGHTMTEEVYRVIRKLYWVGELSASRIVPVLVARYGLDPEVAQQMVRSYVDAHIEQRRYVPGTRVEVLPAAQFPDEYDGLGAGTGWVRCGVCGGEGLLIGRMNLWSYYRCRACGMILIRGPKKPREKKGKK